MLGLSRSMHAFILSRFSRVQLFVTPWTVAYQAPLSMGFFRQDYWSGLPCPSPKDLPDPGIKPCLFGHLHWQVGYLPLSDFTFTFHFHALEKEMATQSSILAWRIPGTAESGRLLSMGSHSSRLFKMMTWSSQLDSGNRLFSHSS